MWKDTDGCANIFKTCWARWVQGFIHSTACLRLLHVTYVTTDFPAVCHLAQPADFKLTFARLSNISEDTASLDHNYLIMCIIITFDVHVL